MSTLDKLRNKHKAERHKWDEEEVRLRNETDTLQCERDSNAKRVSTLQRYQKPYIESVKKVDSNLLAVNHRTVVGKRVVWAKLQKCAVLIKFPFMQPTKASQIRTDVQTSSKKSQDSMNSARSSNGSLPRSYRPRILPPRSSRGSYSKPPVRSASTTKLNSRFNGSQVIRTEESNYFSQSQSVVSRRGSSSQFMMAFQSQGNTPRGSGSGYQFIESLPDP